jgi:hypothetical protein
LEEAYEEVKSSQFYFQIISSDAMSVTLVFNVLYPDLLNFIVFSSYRVRGKGKGITDKDKYKGKRYKLNLSKFV